MKRSILWLVALVVGVSFLLGTGGSSATAASDEEIENSIQNGLAWLAAEQAPDGSWGDWGWSAEAATGLAVLKFEERAPELGFDAFDPDYIYHQQVEDGLNHLFSNSATAGGLVWIAGPSGYYTYNTGIAMMALAASRAPGRVVGPLGSAVDGWTYEQVLTAMLDWMEDAQNDGGCEIGGWGYGANNIGWSDQSNTGYATMGIGFAIAPVFGFGLTVDPNVLDKLGIYIDNIQRPDGGSDYLPINCGAWDASNILRTGNLLYEMALVGRPLADPTVQAAVGYLQDNWVGWDPQAAFTMMKGLEAYRIDILTVGGMDIDWFDEISTIIVDYQNPDGSWPEWWGLHLDTAWNLLTLERVVPPVEGLPGRMTGGGSVLGSRVTHGFTLHCDVADGPSRLQVNWGRGNRFYLENLTSAYCSDDPAIEPQPPAAQFDTYRGAGDGRYNGASGATIEFMFIDTGQPGVDDTAAIVITDAGGDVVLDISGNLQRGDHQAHEEAPPPPE
ncbi:MAG: hypothetical protein V3S68_07010 [Dehalococcoidia bacterium]